MNRDCHERLANRWRRKRRSLLLPVKLLTTLVFLSVLAGRTIARSNHPSRKGEVGEKIDGKEDSMPGVVTKMHLEIVKKE